MDIIVIRHGIALDADKAHGLGLSDEERPLTPEGMRRTRAAAAGLRATLNELAVDDIVTSPLLRAVQTAEILAGYLDDPTIEEADVLAPPVDMAALDEYLHTHFGDRRLLLVALPGGAVAQHGPAPDQYFAGERHRCLFASGLLAVTHAFIERRRTRVASPHAPGDLDQQLA